MASDGTWWGGLKATWPDWLNFTVGAWMILSAFVPDLSGPSPGPVASDVSGVAIAAVSLAAVARVAFWKEWTNFLLGLWLVAAPWVLGIGQFDPFWNFVLDGPFLIGHAGYQIVNPPQQRAGA